MHAPCTYPCKGLHGYIAISNYSCSAWPALLCTHRAGYVVRRAAIVLQTQAEEWRCVWTDQDVLHSEPLIQAVVRKVPKLDRSLGAVQPAPSIAITGPVLDRIIRPVILHALGSVIVLVMNDAVHVRADIDAAAAKNAIHHLL